MHGGGASSVSPAKRASSPRNSGFPRASRAIRSRRLGSGTSWSSASESSWLSGSRNMYSVRAVGAVRVHQHARPAQREHQQVRGTRRAAHEVLDELDRRVVGPVEVVEQQRHRAFAAQQFHQRPQRAVIAEALRRRGGVRRRRFVAVGRGRQDGTEHRAERLDAPRMQRRDVVVERGDRERERDVAFVLGGAALERQQACGAGALGGRLEQGGLADPGLGDHHQHARGAPAHVLERAPDRLQLRIASYEFHRAARRRRDPLYSRRSRDSPLHRAGRAPRTCRLHALSLRHHARSPGRSDSLCSCLPARRPPGARRRRGAARRRSALLAGRRDRHRDPRLGPRPRRRRAPRRRAGRDRSRAAHRRVMPDAGAGDARRSVAGAVRFRDPVAAWAPPVWGEWERPEQPAAFVALDGVEIEVPRTAVLRNAAVAVGQGDASEILSALAAGVPMVLAPRSAGERFNARRIAELRLGVVADGDLDDAIRRVLSFEVYTDRARRIPRRDPRAAVGRRGRRRVDRARRQPGGRRVTWAACPWSACLPAGAQRRSSPRSGRGRPVRR